MRTRPAWCWRKGGVRAWAHEAELSVVPGLLAILPLVGQVVTGDALYCQRNLCAQIWAAGGDYVVIVKGNQPQLYADIALLFREPPVGEVFTMAEERSRHGERQEERRLWASTALGEYLDWPGAEQVCLMERVVEEKGKVTRQVRYAITSLREAGGAALLLERVRGHWGIENRLHYVRDVTFGEDRSQVRTGAAPQVLAALRKVVIGLLRQTGWTNIAAALRHVGWQPRAALQLLGIPYLDN